MHKIFLKSKWKEYSDDVRPAKFLRYTRIFNVWARHWSTKKSSPSHDCGRQSSQWCRQLGSEALSYPPYSSGLSLPDYFFRYVGNFLSQECYANQTEEETAFSDFNAGRILYFSLTSTYKFVSWKNEWILKVFCLNQSSLCWAKMCCSRDADEKPALICKQPNNYIFQYQTNTAQLLVKLAL